MGPPSDADGEKERYKKISGPENSHLPGDLGSTRYRKEDRGKDEGVHDLRDAEQQGGLNDDFPLEKQEGARHRPGW